jgi:hypothetical protein
LLLKTFWKSKPGAALSLDKNGLEGNSLLRNFPKSRLENTKLGPLVHDWLASGWFEMESHIVRSVIVLLFFLLLLSSKECTGRKSSVRKGGTDAELERKMFMYANYELQE